MSPRARRIIIPLVVVGLAMGVVTVMMVASARRHGNPQPQPAAETVDGASTSTSPLAGDAPAVDPPAPFVTATDVQTFTALRARSPNDPVAPLPMGSLDPAEDAVLVEFSLAGAGIERITASNVWETPAAKIQAERHFAAIARGESPVTEPLPDPSLRYVIQETRQLRNGFRGAGFPVPLLAANRLEINGTVVNLFHYNVREDGTHEFIWTSPEPGRFETVIVDEDETEVARVVRQFALGSSYDILIEQRVENLTDTPMNVSWVQYGPGSLRLERSRYMDRRRFRFGYLLSVERSPDRSIVFADDNDLLIERRTFIKRWGKAAEAMAGGEPTAHDKFLTVWPNKASKSNEYELSWFAATNRYFGVAVHPPIAADGSGPKSLASSVKTIIHEVSEDTTLAKEPEDAKIVFTYLLSPERMVLPGETLDFDLGVYAGPLDRHILDELPFSALALEKLILFQMSSFCAICTFQWLAVGLLNFLTLLHDYVFFDWALAIIGLVMVVRLLLHPIVKKSQISMQRFGKVMQAIKPEIDKLQKKFPNDPKKLQTEQMRLMREHGVNPLHMLGCLPMFLQTPIWIALYAMLYFAFDLRQQPAFFGVFQRLTNDAWPFLANLSSADHFFGEFAEPTKFFLWNVTGINLLPFLMGAILFVQQKYMSPPPSPTMSQDQIRQQKMMKIMMVTLFPIMLYSAPSGLTLYILTSSTIGIFESRYVRAHVDAMDLKAPPKKKRTSKPRDAQGRAFADAMKRMEERKRQKMKGKPKTFKKRK